MNVEVSRRFGEFVSKARKNYVLEMAMMVMVLGMAAYVKLNQDDVTRDLILVNCTSMKAKFNMPSSWYSGQEELNGNPSCLAESEEILPGENNSPGFQILERSDGFIPSLNDPDEATLSKRPVILALFSGESGYFKSHGYRVFREVLLNSQTGTCYEIGFSAPENDWPKYQKLAALMVNSVSLDPNS